jgi:hypothetical protein
MPYDVARMLKYATSFARGRWRGRRPLLDDPFAVFSTPWLIETFGCQAVVTVRHPAAIVAGRKRLGYMIDFRELLSQDDLMHDLLSDLREEIEQAAGTDDLVVNGSILWKAIYHAVDVFRRDHPDLIVVRHEDLSTTPIERFGQLYDQLGLPFGDVPRRTIEQATSGPATDAGSSHSWSISRRGVARTGYRSMNSRANAVAWKRTLTPQEVERIHDLTAGVWNQFYTAEEWL